MSEIFKPTYYGPVEQFQAPGSTAIDAETQGTLGVMVLQPCTVTFDSYWWNGKYVETWKGPYGVLKDLPASALKPGVTINDVHDEFGIYGIQRYSAPSPGNDQWGNTQEWIVKTVECKQCTAGDHAILTITYTSSSGNSSSISQAEQDPRSETWQLDWQPYSIRPYAFCKNEPVQNELITAGDAPAETTAWRKNIEDFFKSQNGNKAKWEYQATTGNYFLKLSKAEQLVAQKVMNDTQCIWHYPLVTHIQVARQPIPADVLPFNSKYPDKDLGINMDTLVNSLPDGCPYTFQDNDWKWMKTSDSVQQTRTLNEVTFTRRSIYQGMKDADINYYGSTEFNHQNLENCRWKIGEV